MHIEAGFELGDHLRRVFDLARKRWIETRARLKGQRRLKSVKWRTSTSARESEEEVGRKDLAWHLHGHQFGC